ncbi:hypothetical protein GYA49_05080 [Candidatus Beckwithbacteria bacterium]|nr:hypothetical protein [Candidatus Beckwithbacteria bacterium]
MTKKLKVPFVTVYADSNLLFDTLASIDDGFSIMEEVKTVDENATSSDIKANLKAGFSIPSVFNLFKIGADAELNSDREKSTNKSQESSQVRYHTLGSLLYKLVNSLEDQKLLQTLQKENDFDRVSTGSIIQASGIVSLNPLNNSLEKTIRLIKATELLSSFSDLTPNQNRKEIKKQLDPMKKMRNKLQELLDDINSQGQKALILENSELNFSILFSIYDNFTRDIAGLEFGSHTFTVIGKVVNISQEGADLLERSSLSVFNKQMFTSLFDVFGKLGENFSIPEFKVQLKGKILTIIPIAIYS